MRLLILALMVCVAGPAHAQQQAHSTLNCNIGPVLRVFGGTSWKVLSCNDHASLLILSDVGNPAAPFYFLATPHDGGYAIRGEGNGDKTASKAAADVIAKLTSDDIKALVVATQAMPVTTNPEAQHDQTR